MPLCPYNPVLHQRINDVSYLHIAHNAPLAQLDRATAF